MSDRYASRRCPRCCWALYDGAWGQNPDCYCSGKRLRKVVRLTNEQAAAKIKEKEVRDKLERKLAAVMAERDGLRGDGEIGSSPYHDGPDECPTYYDGCNCSVQNLLGVREQMDREAENWEKLWQQERAENERLRSKLAEWGKVGDDLHEAIEHEGSVKAENERLNSLADFQNDVVARVGKDNERLAYERDLFDAERKAMKQVADDRQAYVEQLRALLREALGYAELARYGDLADRIRAALGEG